MTRVPIELEQTLARARRALLAARSPAGHWEGKLSSSALSTATAVFALWMYRQASGATEDDSPIAAGVRWLCDHQNPDGGWGDTVKSFSNISTTVLCRAALSVAPTDAARAALRRADACVTSLAGGTDPDHLVPALIARYGKDRTFSVPILTMSALAGQLGPGRSAWRRIPQLPFELAAFPQRWFKWLRLPVVSYALPALIAIGLVRHARRPSRNPVALAIRKAARKRATQLLEKIQPEGGGFLEATPLTSFVVMSLVGAGQAGHPVTRRGVDFLLRSARPDGSWPIDTNLATWVTTLAVNALAADPDFGQILPASERLAVRDWLLDQQYRTEHPYTLADPGCWAWTHLPGGVPDADDTPVALLALHHLAPADARTTEAAETGVRWLVDLQNRDGGIPTFCRGWGKFPFDRSSADLSAHALRAWNAWAGLLPARLRRRAARATAGALSYLIRTQRPDGAWLPLWFGNQHAPDDENPTYGTSRVLRCAADLSKGGGDAGGRDWNRAVSRALQWMLQAQNPDGGWGGGPQTPSSIEETALAVEGLSHWAPGNEEVGESVVRGVNWLVARTHGGTQFEPSPIGFYFAKLWYFERLYPLIYTVAALNAVRTAVNGNASQSAPGQSAPLKTIGRCP